MKTNDKIKFLRKELGLTMLEVAKKVGVSEATVSRWESGHISNLKGDKIRLLAEVLQTSIAYLLIEDEPCRTFDSILHNSTSENTIQIIRRTGVQKSYTLSDKQTDLIEGMLEQMPRATDADNTSVRELPRFKAVAHGGDIIVNEPLETPKIPD